MRFFFKVVVSALLSIYLSVHVTSGYKILVISPRFARSHVLFLGHIADTLVDAGHEVTVFLPQVLKNVTITGVKKARVIEKSRGIEDDLMEDNFLKEMWSTEQRSPLGILKMRRFMGVYWSRICDVHLNDVEQMETFRNEKFDLGIGEFFDPCYLAYFRAIGLHKYITLSSVVPYLDLVKPLGIESNPSFVPTMFGSASDSMTYYERVKNLAHFAVQQLIDWAIFEPPMAAVFKRNLGQDFDYKEALSKSAFIMVNADEFIDFPRPISQKIVYIGGIAVQKPKPLDEDYQRLMDAAKEGAVLVSFGSIMKSSLMPLEMKNEFLQTFRAFPQVKFIWKYEIDDEIGSDVPNLRKVKWAPQNDLFAHPNLKAFVSHGGLNSVTESIYAGIPMIAVPLFAEQMRNAKMAEKRTGAIIISKYNLTKECLVDALKAVLYEDRYRTSVRHLQQMVLKKPFNNASERLVKYVEFAAEFGHVENLDMASRKLNFIQYYLLDILVPFGLMFLLFIYFVLFVVLFLLRKSFGFKKSKTD